MIDRDAVSLSSEGGIHRGIDPSAEHMARARSPG